MENFESSSNPEANLQVDAEKVFEWLVPRLAKRLREAVRQREPYEIALDRLIDPAAASEGLSRQASLDLRKAVEKAYKAETMEQASAKKLGIGTTIMKGRIPRRSANVPDTQISGKDRGAGEKDS